MCLLLKTVNKLIAEHRNPWADWVRSWNAPRCRVVLTASWSMFQRLLATYRGITIVNVGTGEATSFWFDSWSTLGPLTTALPALFSHCVDPAVSAADALHTRELALPLRDRLSSAVAAELAALSAKLADLHLGHALDSRQLRWGPEKEFCVGAVYRMLKQTGCSVLLVGVNWDNFTPITVRVFFWVLRHDNTWTRSFLHHHGILKIDHCPFCLDTPEDADNLFFWCPRAAAFWAHVCPGALHPRTSWSSDVFHSFTASCTTPSFSFSFGSFGRATTEWFSTLIPRSCQRWRRLRCHMLNYGSSGCPAD
jgi:hypothetical protein